MRDRELDVDTVRRAYRRWAPVYDLVFGAVFDRGRRAAVAAAERVGGRILEVGVGTGIALPAYSARSRIVGVDLSPAMLDRARERARRLALGNIERLEVMDAEKLGFADASFDVVVAQYVVSTMPHPERALDEFARILRPGGEIVILTRLGAEAGPRRVVERLLQPVVRRLGWRTDFPWERFGRWIGGHDDLRLVERRAMPPFGHFSLVRVRKAGAPARQHGWAST